MGAYGDRRIVRMACFSRQSGVRCPKAPKEVRSPKSKTPAGTIGGIGVHQRFPTFQAGMCMKRTVRSSGSGVSKHRRPTGYSGSWLQSPDFCSSRNEGATGDVVENKRECPEFRVQSLRNICHRRVILAPDSMLLTPVLQEMKVHPEMLLKTHDRENGTREHGACRFWLPLSKERRPPRSGAQMRP